MEGKFAPIYRRGDNRNRRFINTALNISMKFFVTTAFLH